VARSGPYRRQRKETIGGALLLAGAVIALVWANSPWPAGYTSLQGFTVGPAALHLDLSLATWAADGLLAIFFFVAGLELKREFVAGDLSDPRRAAVPIAAALGGVIVPAVLYTVINRSADSGAVQGWAIPTATDIAFALERARMGAERGVGRWPGFRDASYRSRSLRACGGAFLASTGVQARFSERYARLGASWGIRFGSAGRWLW